MRLLFITLEFSCSTFSGNGVYAQSQVRALRHQGHQVLVIAGRPAGLPQGGALPPDNQLEVPLPGWGRLDEGCGWQEFKAGVAAADVVAAVAAFAPKVVLGVDWHSLGAWRALQLAGALRSPRIRLAARRSGALDAPYIYLNYRVYARTATGEAHTLLLATERDAVDRAAAVVCLSRSDAAYIQQHLQSDREAQPPQVLLPALRADMEQLPLPPSCAEHAARTSGSVQPADPAQLAFAAAGAAAEQPGSSAGARDGSLHAAQPSNTVPPRRRYLTCCVRLSPEKEPERFVAAVEALAGSSAAPAAQNGALCADADSRHWEAARLDAACNGSQDVAAKAALPNRLQKLGVVPLLFGSVDTPYAAKLKARLRDAVPDAVIEEHFLEPSDLAKRQRHDDHTFPIDVKRMSVVQIYAATRLNVHPCTYDAYGMTAVEAASQGAPSLIMSGGVVGATDLLSNAAGECFETDMRASAVHLADEIERLLRNPVALGVVGARAAAKARGWTEVANAMRLMQIVSGVADSGAA